MGYPSDSIVKLAEYALTESKFRVDGSVDGALKTVLTGYPGTALTPDEVEFVEGWLFLAREQYSKTNEGLDHHIVRTIKENQNSTTRSG